MYTRYSVAWRTQEGGYTIYSQQISTMRIRSWKWRGSMFLRWKWYSRKKVRLIIINLAWFRKLCMRCYRTHQSATSGPTFVQDPRVVTVLTLYTMHRTPEMQHNQTFSDACWWILTDCKFVLWQASDVGKWTSIPKRSRSERMTK